MPSWRPTSPRYAGVAERAGLADAFARASQLDVVERVPGSSSTDFWGIAHVPSQVEREVAVVTELERRLDLLQACWAYFDDVATRVSSELLPGPRSAGRSRDQIVRHVYANEPEQFSRKVEVRTPQEVVLTSDGLRAHRAAYLAAHPCVQRRRQARSDLADPVPHPPHGSPRDGPRVGDGGPRPGSELSGVPGTTKRP